MKAILCIEGHEFLLPAHCSVEGLMDDLKGLKLLTRGNLDWVTLGQVCVQIRVVQDEEVKAK